MNPNLSLNSNLMSHNLELAILAIIDKNRRLHRSNIDLTVYVVFNINAIKSSFKIDFRISIINYFENRIRLILYDLLINLILDSIYFIPVRIINLKFAQT